MTRARRRQDPARCRNVLAIGAAAFCLLQFAAGFAIDWVWPGIRYPELPDRLAKIALEPRTPDLVYFGSSRFGSAFSPAELTHELRDATGNPNFRAVGMTVPCGDTIAIERVYREMLRRDIRPPTIVIESAPYSYCAVNGWYSTHIFRQLECADLPEHGWEIAVSGNAGRFVLARTMPLYLHRYQLLKTLWAKPTMPQGAGPGPRHKMTEAQYGHWLNPTTPVTQADHDRASGGAEMMGHAYRNYTVGGASIRALERILDECRQSGTRVILIGSPLSSAHRREITPEIDARYRGYVDKLAERFGVPFVDCRDVLPDSLMVDHHHILEPEGAVVFSRYAAREVIGPWLVGRSVPGRLVNDVKHP